LATAILIRNKSLDNTSRLTTAIALRSPDLPDQMKLSTMKIQKMRVFMLLAAMLLPAMPSLIAQGRVSETPA
jgi:hypothetical protein